MTGFAARRGQANGTAYSHLRTPVRRVIITFIAHLVPTENAPEIPPPETRP